ncbi:hypothetical protein ARAM_002156 [Aspergillus rambellii]|uniref:Enoyl reductase (ER) domain-containing protein n=3 Tax=Aspergillus subgen. Nidulantes TaxID=2720870 RepID=A0A0F8UV31_9EURO|nr:hypothetical protein ARAM_002156 [Aspergillus rambellii]
MVQNKTLVFANVPQGLPVAGKDLTIENRPIDLNAPLPPGSVLAKTLHISFDPYLRHRLIHPHAVTEFPHIPLNEPIPNTGIVKVLAAAPASPEAEAEAEAEAPFPVGAILRGMVPIQEYVVLGAADLPQFERIANPLALDLRYFLGPLGMPGLTAYSAFYEIAQPKPGETLFVSAASGAVGQIVCQLAKREGLRVIGSVGSEEKRALLVDRVGVDHAFNYRSVGSENVREELRRLAPDGIDIYYDNVGGEQLEAAIYELNHRGRIVACGYASQYQKPAEQRYGVRNTGLVVGKCLTWRGLSVFEPEFGPKYGEEHLKRVQEWIQNGSIKPILDVTKGIDHAAEGLVRLFTGENIGKAVLDLSQEEEEEEEE